MSRGLRGFLYGCLTPVVLACIAATVFTVVTDARGALFVSIWMAIALSAPISFATAIVLGLPTYYLLRSQKWTSMFAYVLAGFLLTLVPAGLIIADDVLGGPPNEAQRILSRIIEALALVSGPAAAFVFWSTARPDKTSAGQARLLAFSDTE